MRSTDLIRCARTALFVALASFVSAAAQAADAIPSPLIPVAFAGDPGEIALTGVRTTLDPTLYRVVKENAAIRLEGFSLGKGLQVDLDLEQFDVLTPDAQLVISDGVHDTLSQRPDMVMLRGTIVNDPTSLVFVTLSPNGTNGYIRTGNSQFIIAGLPGGGAYVYDLSKADGMAVKGPVCQGALLVPGQNNQVALADDMILPPHAMVTSDNKPGPMEATNCRTIRVMIDTDWEYCNNSHFTGNSAAAQTYAITLYGAISEIYRRDVNVSLAVPYVRVWTTNADPYPDGSVIGDRLNQFRGYWHLRQSPVTRDIAALLSGTEGGGVAWLGTLCNREYGYGANGNIGGAFPYPLKDHNGGNWDVMVCAHELGHNFNAPHTHDMTPQVDGCGTGDCSAPWGGTIMSYCHACAGGMTNIVLAFHSRTINEAMVPYLAGPAASCGLSQAPIQITTGPQPHTVRVGTTTQFNVVSDGDGPKTFAWVFNFKPVVDGPVSGGGTISGATTDTLTITGLTKKNNGPYKVTVSNSCSSQTSASVVLLVRCAADIDLDGAVDLDDFFQFLNCFDTSALCSDMDSSGDVDLNDFFAFLNAFDADC